MSKEHDDGSVFVEALIELVEFNGSLGDRNVRGRDGVAARTGALLAAFNAHAFAVAEATIPLWRNDWLQVAARPLARMLYETGVFAQWIAQEPEAAGAMVALYSEDRRKLADNFAKVPRLAHAAGHIEASRIDVASPLRGVAASFASVCARFVDGDELYAHYRLLCGHSHAGIEIADQWLAPDEGGLAFRVLDTPRRQNGALVALGLMGLLMTASAFEESLDPGSLDIVAFLDRISDESSAPRSLRLKTARPASRIDSLRRDAKSFGGRAATH